MSLMSRHTGRPISPQEHARQSILDILTTPIGSRLHRREYGSELPRLIDQPGNAATLLRAQAASASAISRWYPRLRISAVNLHIDQHGRAHCDIESPDLIDGSLKLPLGDRA